MHQHNFKRYVTYFLLYHVKKYLRLVYNDFRDIKRKKKNVFMLKQLIFKECLICMTVLRTVNDNLLIKNIIKALFEFLFYVIIIEKIQFNYMQIKLLIYQIIKNIHVIKKFVIENGS